MKGWRDVASSDGGGRINEQRWRQRQGFSMTTTTQSLSSLSFFLFYSRFSLPDLFLVLQVLLMVSDGSDELVLFGVTDWTSVGGCRSVLLIDNGEGFVMSWSGSGPSSMNPDLMMRYWFCCCCSDGDGVLYDCSSGYLRRRTVILGLQTVTSKKIKFLKFWL